MIAYRTLLTVGLLHMIGAEHALAQEGDWQEDDNNSPWSIEIEAGVETEPAYTGSDVYSTEADANIEVAYRAKSGHEYFVSLGEIGVRWALGADRQLSTLFEYEPGRENSNDSALDGFPTVQDTVEFQLVYQQKVGALIAGALVQHDIQNRGKGTVGFVGIAYPKQISSRFGVQLQLDVSFANAEHMNTEVGISEETAQLTAYDAYSTKSGYKGATISLDTKYALTKHISLLAGVSLEQYGSIMADSPLIKDEGSASTYEASVGLKYEF